MYVELSRLNVGNNEIITRFYEDNFGKKNKFNYDGRGLYSESEINAKKTQLANEIYSFEQKDQPDQRSNST